MSGTPDFRTSLQPVQDDWPKIDSGRTQPGPQERWLRKIDLIVFDAAVPTNSAGSSLNLTPDKWVQLQVTFQVRKVTNQTPNMLFARIYNLSPNTINKVANYRRVTLNAGYQNGPYGTVFTGNVVQYRRGKENATDTYLEIYAGDGDRALGYDTVTNTSPPGTTAEQRVKDAISRSSLETGMLSMGGYGNEKLIRSLTESRTLAQFMRAESLGGNFDWWVDDGKVFAISKTGYVPGTIVELTPKTGLVGIPEVTPQGIQIKSLLDPNLKIGGLVKVKTELISGVPFLPGSGAANPVAPEDQTRAAQLSVASWGQQLTLPAFTSPTGTYKILMMDVTGETRGNSWYCDMVCVALDKTNDAIPSVGLPYERISAQAAATFVRPPAPEEGSSTNL